MASSVCVSVTMVSLNRETYLAAAVDSILSQTFGDWELILVDNGSSDGTYDVMKRYEAGDGRVRAFRRPGLNLPEVRNAALAHAVGTYVAVLDSDDLAMPDRLERQIAFMESNPGIAGCGSGFDFIDAAGASIHVDKYKKRPTDPEELRRLERDGWSCFLHSSMIFRRSALEKAGGYRRAFDTAEDDDLYLRLLDDHDLANVPEQLARYRWHGENACTPSLEVQLRRVAAVASAHMRLNRLPDTVDSHEGDLDSGFVLAALERLGPAAGPAWLFLIGLLQFYRFGQDGLLDRAWRAVLALPADHAADPEVLRHWRNFRRDFPKEAESVARNTEAARRLPH